MAEQDPRSMSIVPYSANRDIVLRHDDAIVVFDRTSRQIELHNSTTLDNEVGIAECPYCHRLMRESSPDTPRDIRHGSGSAVQPGFVNPDYFRMLGASLPGTPERSAPPSPRRRLVQEARPDSRASESEREPTPSAPGISSAAFSQGYFQRFFTEERELGRGGKGVVLLVKHVLDGVSLGQYACKRVPVGDDHQWLKKVLIEVQLLQHLSHQNLVSYRHVWLENAKLSNFGPSVPCAFILQQYCNAGDLHRYICGSAPVQTTTQQLKDRIRRKSKGQPEPAPNISGGRKLGFDQIYSFFKDITSGLHFLHINNYIHRDLKPSNCLLHETGHELRVLVSDFGEVQSENTVRTSTGNTGTVSYCAPEVLRRVAPSGPFGNFTYKSDVFSLGMILYFLCFAQLPYRNADIIDEDREDLDKLRAEISQWTGFDDIKRLRPDLPDQLYSFLKRLLSVDPDKRPTADEVLSGIQTGVGINEGRRSHRNGPAVSDIRSGARALSADRKTGPSSTLPHAQRSPNKVLPTSPFPSTVQSRRGYGSTEESATRYESSSSPSQHQFPPTEHDLILRHPISTNRESPTHHSAPPYARPSPLLLPPPDPSSTRIYLRNHRLAANVLLFTVLIFKIASIMQPCAPLLVVPWIFYPLVILAVLDFAFSVNIWVHVAALAFHFLVIALAMRSDLLCVWAPGF